ncbi:hypothetical protein GCM10023201_43120 [Actinomycetospora corticicola]|uniref:Uncharacterized protein n=1 Tax=Actinomycetospora corticicola TaxID=663602 RepID=A0A7Y9DW52_9PSEU|nr:hypothetical protein [Actinomycetospora corticicola]NYD36597.1 hypothetical protein [Actinomycetospora corticicola]
MARWAPFLTAGLVALGLTVVAGVLVGRWVARDVELDRGITASPTAAEVASAAGFCALPVPPAPVGPLRREQGIDGLVVFRVLLDGGSARDWLAGGGMPSAVPSVGAADLEFGPDLPSGTPVVAQHRAPRPGGGIVYRSAVLGPGAVEVRCFET